MVIGNKVIGCLPCLPAGRRAVGKLDWSLVSSHWDFFPTTRDSRPDSLLITMLPTTHPYFIPCAMLYIGMMIEKTRTPTPAPRMTIKTGSIIELKFETSWSASRL